MSRVKQLLNIEGIEDLDLDTEEYTNFMNELDEFYENFYSKLAGSKNWEVLSYTDEEGNTFTHEQLLPIIKECKRLGIRIIWKVDNGNHQYFICLDTMKIGIPPTTTVH